MLCYTYLLIHNTSLFNIYKYDVRFKYDQSNFLLYEFHQCLSIMSILDARKDSNCPDSLFLVQLL